MIRGFLIRFSRDERGATAIEYGLIVALMFLVIIGALQVFGATGSGLINVAMDTLRVGMGG